MSPFNRANDFLLCSLVTMALSRVVFEIFNVEKYHDLEVPVRGSIKVIESGTITGYGFLLAFYSNFVFEIFDFKNAVTFKTGLGVCQGH